MNKLVSFSEWLQVRDPDLYSEAFTPLHRKVLGGVGLGLGALGSYMGFGGSGNEAPKMPPTPAPHVRSVGSEFQSKMPVAPPSMGDKFQDKMPAEPPYISKTQDGPRDKWSVKDELSLARAIREAGMGHRNLRTSGVPHGSTIDVDSDGSPDNPTENYFNTGDRTFYGKGGKALWTFDGQQIISVR